MARGDIESLPWIGAHTIYVASSIRIRTATAASRIYGEEHKRIAAKLIWTQLAYKKAIAANADFVRGRADPWTRLSNQPARRTAAEAAGDNEDDA